MNMIIMMMNLLRKSCQFWSERICYLESDTIAEYEVGIVKNTGEAFHKISPLRYIDIFHITNNRTYICMKAT